MLRPDGGHTCYGLMEVTHATASWRSLMLRPDGGHTCYCLMEVTHATA